MNLNQKLCDSYYCQQAGGGPYFQGIAHQRGYGFFGDLRRYITPIALSTGKYLGKKMLKTGGNVISDVASGKSFRESAKSRLRETGKSIRDDFFKKLQGGSGAIKRKCKKNSSQCRAKRRKVVHNDIFSLK